MTVAVESKTYLPEEEVAGRFGEIVAALSAREAAPRLVVGGETVDLSPAMADVLARVARAMQQGLAVTVAPQGTRLTTQEAADMLGISRSTQAGSQAGSFVMRERSPTFSKPWVSKSVSATTMRPISSHIS